MILANGKDGLPDTLDFNSSAGSGSLFGGIPTFKQSLGGGGKMFGISFGGLLTDTTPANTTGPGVSTDTIGSTLPTGLDQPMTPIAQATIPTGTDSTLASIAASSPALADYSVTPVTSAVMPSVAQPTAIAQKGTLLMKSRGLIILGLLFGAALLFGQTDDTLYVKNFQGLDVGQKVTAAMGSCAKNSSNPCYLIVDSSLATAAAGTLPPMCSNCFLVDYRFGHPYEPLTPDALEVASVDTFNGASHYASCPTIATSGGGGSGASFSTNCAFHVGPNYYTLNTITVTRGGTYTTPPALIFTPAGTPPDSIAVPTMKAKTPFIMPSYAVDITAPPYSAKCDGTTVDAIAIQTALNENSAIFIPASGEGGTQCNLGTIGLTLNTGNRIFGNGQYFGYSGTGVVITADNGTIHAEVDDLTIDMTGSTGTPTVYLIHNADSIRLSNDWDFSGPDGYISLSLQINNPDFVTVEGFYGGGALKTGIEDTPDLASTISSSRFLGPSFINAQDFSLHAVEFWSDLTIGDLATSIVHLSAVEVRHNLTFGAHAQAVSGLVNLDVWPPSTSVIGAPASGQVTYSDVTGDSSHNLTVNYGLNQMVGITGFGSKGPVCVDAGGLIYTGDNSGSGPPCP